MRKDIITYMLAGAEPLGGHSNAKTTGPHDLRSDDIASTRSRRLGSDSFKVVVSLNFGSAHASLKFKAASIIKPAASFARQAHRHFSLLYLAADPSITLTRSIMRPLRFPLTSSLFFSALLFVVSTPGAAGQAPPVDGPTIRNTPKKDTRLKPDQVLTLDGKVVSRTVLKPTMLKVLKNKYSDYAATIDAGQLMSNVDVVQTPDQPPQDGIVYILDAADRVELSQSEIATKLDDLFKWGPAKNRYSAYFTLLPGQQSLKADNNGPVLAAAPNTTVIYQPYGLQDKTIGLRVSLNTTLTGLPQFSGAGLANAIFARLDAFDNGYVPLSVVDQIESNFLNGLVTRLMLGQYERSLKNPASELSWAKNVPVPNLPKEFSQPASYTTGAFEDNVANLLRDHPVQPMGMYLGWRAGEELDALSGEDEHFRQDVLTLLRGRFTPAQFGEMTAFTMKYLVGYVKCSRIQQIIIGGAAGAATPSTNDIAAIFKNLSNDDEVSASASLVSGFHRAVVGEFYALSLNTSLTGKKRERMLSSDAAFINGFEAGTVAASDQVFVDVFQLGFGIGYKDGFRDGYAQGYAAGWRDGYAAGYAQAWKEAQVVIDKLQQQLNDANSQNAFWNNAGKIGGAIVAIAAFF